MGAIHNNYEVKYNELIAILKDIKNAMPVEYSVDVSFIFLKFLEKKYTKFDIKEFTNNLK